MSKFTLFLISVSILTTSYLLPSTSVLARVTPEDIVNQRRGDFTTKFDSYSPENQQKIQTFMDNINQANADATAELNAIMLRQGAILDEYLSRKNFVETESIKDSRYYLTFAHEAIDYQKQRIYIPNLTSEANLKSDLNNLLSNFQSQLNYARNTAVKSLDKISNTVNGGGSQKIAAPTEGGGE